MVIWTRKKVSPPTKYRQWLIIHYKNTTRRVARCETYTVSTVLYEEMMELTAYGVSTEACRVLTRWHDARQPSNTEQVSMTFFNFELSAATTRRASDTVYMEKIPGQLKVLKGLVSKLLHFQIIQQSDTHPHLLGCEPTWCIHT